MTRNLRIVLLTLFPLLSFLTSLFIGAYAIQPSKVLKTILHELLNLVQPVDTAERAIIIDIRVPRVILAGIVGACLSSSGATLQGIFRNPLVDPFILGISAGSAFGAAISIGFLDFLPTQILSFLFAILAVSAAYLVAKTHGEVSRLALVLSGVVVSSFFTALVSIVKFLVDPHRLQSIVFWLMGSFSLADWKAVKISSLALIFGVLPLILMRWRLNVLSMGEEEAKVLGVDVKRERILLILFSTLSVSVCTSLTGIIGWVGLIVPHLVRMIVGPDHRILIPMSAACGSGFMILADTISRTLTTFDIPVGIVTSLLGTPFFIYLMRGGTRTWVR